MIDGVLVTPLQQIVDERGKIMKMLSRQDPHFREFGEVYFSCVVPGAVKAWRRHRQVTLNYAVPVGRIRFVIYDDRPDSPSRGALHEFLLGPDNYCLVTVPPMIWNGFQGIGNDTAVVANCATGVHDPSEAERLAPFTDQIPFAWTRPVT